MNWRSGALRVAGAALLLSSSACGTAPRPVAPSAMIVSAPLAQVYGTVVWVAAEGGEAVVELYGSAPAMGTRLAVRDEGLAVTATVVAVGPLRGRMLGVRVSEGRPRIGDEVADLPPERDFGRGR